MVNWMALRYSLSLSIVSAAPLVAIVPAAANTTVADLENPSVEALQSTPEFGPEVAKLLSSEHELSPDQADGVEAADTLHSVSQIRPVEAVAPPLLDRDNLNGDKVDQWVPQVAQLLQDPEPDGQAAEAEPSVQEAESSQDVAQNQDLTQPLSELEPGASQPAALTQDPEPTGFTDTPDSIAPAERSQVFFQAAFLQQGDDSSARLRVGGIYVLSPSVFAGATVDLSTGESFSDNDRTGLNLNELYITASPANLPELRLTAGLMDLTSYVDRNSFAKDSLTHFFNPVFQTNPALSTVNISSRPGLLVNWTPIDQLSLTATTFSSRRGLGNFSLDSFAGEVGVRFGNAILRGTYVTSRDAGQGDGFAELASVDRGNGQFGARLGDRETGFGLNAEAFIPSLNLGIFGRYGWYTNQELGVSGQTYSVGVNGLDVFMAGDRLGLGYGRQLSNNALRQASGNSVPDVWELFYDAKIFDNLRAGISLQQRNAWTETYLGFRVRYDLVWNPLRRSGQ